MTWDDKDNQRPGGIHWNPFGWSVVLLKPEELMMVQG